MANRVLLALAAGAAYAGYRAIRGEMKRVERKLAEIRAERLARTQGVPLERDPRTGVYRARKE